MTTPFHMIAFIHRTVRRWCCAGPAALIGCVLCVCAIAKADTVVIVVSSEATPYVDAQTALKDDLESGGVTTRTIQLSALTDADLSSADDADVDAYVAVGTPATLWLYRRLDPRITLVSCVVSEQIESKLDGHRGLAMLNMQLTAAQQFELLLEALPQAQRIGMLYSSRSDSSRRLLQRAQEALPVGMTLNAVDVDAHESRARAIKTLLKTDPDVIWTEADRSVYDGATVKSLLLAAIRKRTPVFGFSPAFVRSGALLGIGVNPAEQGRLSGDVVRELLARPDATDAGQFVVWQADRSELAVNLVVASKIGVDLPEAMVTRATHVYK